MCAAPGSKVGMVWLYFFVEFDCLLQTAQLLEALHAQDSPTSTSIPSGLLLANDSDNKRTQLLIHQSARLPSPALMVTNLDASIYPVLRYRPPGSDTLEQLQFDRILCDVPCSGDGTIRKNIGIWKTWQPMDGNGLHALVFRSPSAYHENELYCSLQFRILQRAMKLMKKDGRIVYSTCSLNPVENEAVIAEALKSNPGRDTCSFVETVDPNDCLLEFYLVDVSSKLPELKRRPGLTTWRPSIDREITTSYETYRDFLSSPHAQGNPKLTEGHWPPDEVEHFNLPRWSVLCSYRCVVFTDVHHFSLRIYPHLQDSGGFFVAVLERRLHSGDVSAGMDNYVMYVIICSVSEAGTKLSQGKKKSGRESRRDS